MIYAGLIAFFFLEYLRPTSYLPALTVLHLNTIVPLATAAASLVTAGQATVQRVVNDPNTRMIVILLGLVWLSFLTADVQMAAWNAFVVVSGFGLMHWVIASEVTSVRKFKGLIIALIAVHVMVAALNPVLFTDPERRHYVTSGAFLGDGNDLALSIVIILPLCLFLLLDSKRMIGKALWAGAMLMLVAVVILTQSRGGTLGLACMGLYYWTKSRRKVQTGIAAAVVVVLVLALAPGNYFERMRTIGDTTEGSASARLTAWGVAVQMAIDRPLLGVGAAHFSVKIGNEYRPADFVGSGMNAHSIYFLALGELGLPGFFLLLSFIGWNLRANQKLSRELKARNQPVHDWDVQMLASTSAALIAFASAGAFLSALYYPHLYVLAGILSAGRNVAGRRLREAPTLSTQPAAGREVSVHWALKPRPRPAVGHAGGPRARIDTGPAEGLRQS